MSPRFFVCVKEKKTVKKKHFFFVRVKRIKRKKKLFYLRFFFSSRFEPCALASLLERVNTSNRQHPIAPREKQKREKNNKEPIVDGPTFFFSFFLDRQR